MTGDRGDTADAPAVPIGIKGGAAGHAAITEDLERAAWALEAAASEVDEASLRLREARYLANLAIHGATAPVRPYVVSARDEVDAAITGHAGVKGISRDMEDAGQRLKAVARAYENAENGAGRAMSRGERYALATLDVLRVVSFPARVTWGSWWKLTRPGGEKGEWVGDALMPGRLPRVTDIFNGRTLELGLRIFDLNGMPFSPYKTAVNRLSLVLTGLERFAGEPRYVGAARQHAPAQRSGPESIEDLLQGIIDIPDEGARGVAVDTIVNDDGTRSHVVYIPGTNDTSLVHPSTFDWNSNFQSVLGGTSDTTRFVTDALEAAGVESGEPLMLVGHSQGGIVAWQLASSEVAERYNITHAVAAGAPVGQTQINENVQYLGIAHDADPVTGLDGKPVPDLPNVTSVAGYLNASTDPEIKAAAATVSAAHSLTNYKATARSADAATHASMRAWRDSASGFLGERDVTRQIVEPTFEAANPQQATQAKPVPDPMRPPASLLKCPAQPFPWWLQPDPWIPSEMRDTILDPKLGTTVPILDAQC